MKFALTTLSLALAFVAAQAQAQPRIWRCGNTYTNDASAAQAGNCKPVETNNVTVVEGTRVNTASTVRVATAAPSASGTRIDSPEQKARDTEARSILEAELKKAETRQAELLKEYNNGEPEKQGSEGRNYQKYLDRVEELKSTIARNENDIAGLKRELARMGGTPAKQ